MGIVLDCSGHSVVSKKMKHSCHIHFPQVVCTMSELKQQTSSLRRFIAASFFANERKSALIAPGQIVTYRNKSTGRDVLGRVVFSAPLLMAGFESYEFQGKAVPAIGTVQNNILEYLSLPDLHTVACVSTNLNTYVRLFLYSVLRSDTGPERFSAIVGCQAPSDKRPGDTLATPEAVLHDLRSEPNLNYVIVVAVMPAPFETFAGAHLDIRSSYAGVELVQEEKDVEHFVASCSSLFTKSTMKATEYYQTFVRPLLERSMFDAMLWEKTIDHGLVESRKLRMYLNDKFDTVYGQEYRPLKMKYFLTRDGDKWPLNPALPLSRDQSFSREATPMTNSSMQSPCDTTKSFSLNGLEVSSSISSSVGEVQVPHAAMLKLTSLRSTEYFDAYGKLCYCDDERIFANVPMPSNVPQEQIAKYKQRMEQLHMPIHTPGSDILPDFNALTTSHATTVSEWQLWLSGCFSITEVKETTNGKPTRHAALMPAYWQYDPTTNSTSFVVAGQTYLTVADKDIASALAPSGDVAQGLMHRLSRILVPHVAVLTDFKVPSMYLNRDVLPLFVEHRGGKGGGGGVRPVAVSVPGVTLGKQPPSVQQQAQTQVQQKPQTTSSKIVSSILKNTSSSTDSPAVQAAPTVTSSGSKQKFNYNATRFKDIKLTCLSIPGVDAQLNPRVDVLSYCNNILEALLTKRKDITALETVIIVPTVELYVTLVSPHSTQHRGVLWSVVCLEHNKRPSTDWKYPFVILVDGGCCPVESNATVGVVESVLTWSEPQGEVLFVDKRLLAMAERLRQVSL